MKKSAKEKYHLNDFTKRLIPELNFILDSDTREGFSLENNNYHLLTDKEKYIVSVHNDLVRIDACIEQMEYVSVFVRRFPLKDYYKKNGINQLNYIQYHLETLSHKVATLLDLMKLMVNVVYQAEITERDCSWDNLKKIIDQKEKPMKIINIYFDFFGDMIEFRHNVTHKGKFRDDAMKKINLDYGFSLYEQMKNLGIEPSAEMLRMRPLWLIEYEIKNYRKNRLEQINNHIQQIYILMKSFLESLTPQFQKKLKELN